VTIAASVAECRFDRIRPYEPGDDVRRIDWNATARSLVPQVREDVPDRQLTAWILLDTSASMIWNGRMAQADGRGCSSSVGRLRPAWNRLIDAWRGRERGQLLLASTRDALHPRFETEPRGGPRQTSPAKALGIVAATRSTPGVVVIVSDFRGPRDWVPALTNVAGRHAVIALEVTDPREDALVDVGELTLIDPETGRTLRVDTGDRRLRTAFDEAAAADRASLGTSFTRLGVRHLRL
jgi:uncharacterized protein (DUF58 family)